MKLSFNRKFASIGITVVSILAIGLFGRPFFSYAECALIGDLDCSGKVNAVDLSILLANFGKKATPQPTATLTPNPTQVPGTPAPTDVVTPTHIPLTPIYHLGCKNNRCMPVDGEGENTCSIDTDCTNPTAVPTAGPTLVPTAIPTATPTPHPTLVPTATPVILLTITPTDPNQ